MTEKVHVFDFDGTCTVPVTGADANFLRAHQSGFAEFAGKTLEWAIEQYAAARAMIAINPDDYGWEINGQIVAPALVDAFVEAQVCAQIVLRKMGEDVESWTKRLEELYQVNYLKHQTTFRNELLETLSSLRARGVPFYIVSNSDPAKVRKRLTALGDDAAWIDPVVYGYAKKYVVTPGPDSVPERMSFPGLRRSVELRKQHYYAVLTSIMETHRISWDGLTVIGDIAELDLAMPVTMGARGHLIVGPNTPSYERRWAEEHPLVDLITDLRQAV